MADKINHKEAKEAWLYIEKYLLKSNLMPYDQEMRNVLTKYFNQQHMGRPVKKV